jgi:glycosyltransferase involved in cell wall biosynthesis
MHAPGAQRVLHVLAQSSGGIRRHVRYLAAHPPEGFVTAGVMGPSSVAEYFDELEFRVWEGRRPWRSMRPDVVHAHGLTAGIRAIGSTILSPDRPPVVVTVHTSAQQTLRATMPGAGLPYVQTLMWNFARALIARADAVIAVSKEVAAHFGATDTVAPAIDLPTDSATPREAVRRSLEVPEDAIVVLAVGRLHPDKALHLFIEALRGTGAAGWIAGEGPDRPRLEKLAAGTAVRLLGQRDDVPSLMGAADIFALPTAGESYGLAVVEAVAAGLPVVATRTGAIPEIVGDAGLLVPSDDPAGFADAVHRLIDDPELRLNLALAAKRRELPSAEDLAAEVGRIYERVIGKRRR